MWWLIKSLQLKQNRPNKNYSRNRQVSRWNLFKIVLSFHPVCLGYRRTHLICNRAEKPIWARVPPASPISSLFKFQDVMLGHFHELSFHLLELSFAGSLNYGWGIHWLEPSYESVLRPRFLESQACAEENRRDPEERGADRSYLVLKTARRI